MAVTRIRSSLQFYVDQNLDINSKKLINVAIGVDPTDGINKSQLDDAVSGLQDFRESVIDKDLLTPPVSPTAGDRYIIGQPTDTATGAWVGHEGEIADWNGTAWIFEPQPDMGTYCFVEDESAAYVFNNNTFASGLWVLWNTGLILAGEGLTKTGNTISVDWADTSVQTGAEDSRAVKYVDLYSNGANQGANIIGGDPTNISQSTETDVQGILEDISSALEAIELTNQIYNEAGTVTNGSADVSVANAFVAGTLQVFLNGELQREGASEDYTVSGTTVTFSSNLVNVAGHADKVTFHYYKS